MGDRNVRSGEKKANEQSGYGKSGGNSGAGKSGRENLGSEKPSDGAGMGSHKPGTTDSPTPGNRGSQKRGTSGSK
jgi:hypothetical protein